jgi:peptidoglycan hydrolase-like protein with peptidoglycan-binding domain
MIDRNSARAALVLTGFIALAGCSFGDHHAEARNSYPAPVQTASSAQAPVATESPEVSPGMLKRVQTALQGEGLYTGSIDGRWGPKTQGALRGYQQSHGLSENGELDSATLASLRIASASGTPAAPNATPVAAAPTTN